MITTATLLLAMRVGASIAVGSGIGYLWMRTKRYDANLLDVLFALFAYLVGAVQLGLPAIALIIEVGYFVLFGSWSPSTLFAAMMSMSATAWIIHAFLGSIAYVGTIKALLNVREDLNCTGNGNGLSDRF